MKKHQLPTYQFSDDFSDKVMQRIHASPDQQTAQAFRSVLLVASVVLLLIFSSSLFSLSTLYQDFFGSQDFSIETYINQTIQDVL